MAFRSRYPHIDIRLAIGNTSEVVRGVHDGAAEIGFVEGAFDDPELVSAAAATPSLSALPARRALIVARGRWRFATSV